MLVALAALLVLTAPLSSRADAVLASTGTGPRLAMVDPQPPFRSAHVQAHFDHTMRQIVAELPDVVVTSTFRTEEDQERLAVEGYLPHPHSQHKLGFAWDCTASADSLRLLAERARAHGFKAVEYPSSPVTGESYVHVQLYERSPLSDPASVLYAAPPAPRRRAVPKLIDFADQRIEAPRVLVRPRLEFPRRLLRKKVEGRVVLVVGIDPKGAVTDVRVDSSDLPDFDAFVANAVRSWKFEPPTLHGHPIEGRARLPIPIVIN